MEENPMFPKDDAMASQVLETISKITLEALQTPEEPEERDVCSIDEGDDSVFYSDEDQAHKDIKANRSRDFVAIGYRRPFNSVASDAPIQQEKDDEGAEAIAVPSSEGKEANLQVIRSEQEEECKELQQTDPADPDVAPDLTPESGGSLQLNTLTDLLTQLEENKSSFEGKRSLLRYNKMKEGGFSKCMFILSLIYREFTSYGGEGTDSKSWTLWCV